MQAGPNIKTEVDTEVRRYSNVKTQEAKTTNYKF